MALWLLPKQQISVYSKFSAYQLSGNQWVRLSQGSGAFHCDAGSIVVGKSFYQSFSDFPDSVLSSKALLLLNSSNLDDIFTARYLQPKPSGCVCEKHAADKAKL